MLGEKYISYLRLFFLLLCGAGISLAMMLPRPDEAPKVAAFSFIRTDLNRIENNLRGLRSFYEQLDRLEKGEINTVRIVHIGDSHIQADGFSGKVRLSFHQRFGVRGRGLVFPYSVAKTTSPPDIRCYSNASWSSKRNIYTGGGIPIGLAGITMRTSNANFNLNLSITNNDRGIDYSFDKITVFSEKGPRYFDLSANVKMSAHPSKIAAVIGPGVHEVQVGETLSIIADKYGCSVKDIQEWNEIEDENIYAEQKLIIQVAGAARPVANSNIRNYAARDNRYSQFSSTILLNQPVRSVSLQGRREISGQVQTTLYGMVLENTQSAGVLYHMAGVNGAKYEHFNASQHFQEQISELTPDLIIISLGTNETISGGFSPGDFYRQIDQLVLGLQQNMPQASILITTPPDSYLTSRFKNTNGARAKDLLVNYSLNNDFACWNLFDVMGGEGSMELWYKNGLAQNDRIHFTWKGYGIQGDLLFEALMNGYGAFQSYRPR